MLMQPCFRQLNIGEALSLEHKNLLKIIKHNELYGILGKFEAVLSSLIVIQTWVVFNFKFQPISNFG